MSAARNIIPLFPVRANRRQTRRKARKASAPQASGPKPMRQPNTRRAGHSFTLPKARLAALWSQPACPRLAALLSSIASEMRRADAVAAEKRECLALLACLTAKAVEEEWSARELARQAGIPWPTWCHFKTGDRPLAPMVPLLRAAVAKLNQVGSGVHTAPPATILGSSRREPAQTSPEELAP